MENLKKLATLKGKLKKWTIQRNWYHCLHKTQDEDKKKTKKQKKNKKHPYTQANNVIRHNSELRT